MRFYTYVSDAKLAQFVAQVPEGLLSRIAAEFKIGLKVVSLTMKTGGAETGRYDRLRIVERRPSWSIT